MVEAATATNCHMQTHPFGAVAPSARSPEVRRESHEIPLWLLSHRQPGRQKSGEEVGQVTAPRPVGKRSTERRFNTSYRVRLVSVQPHVRPTRRIVVYVWGSGRLGVSFLGVAALTGGEES